jgi:hypothetical protein
MFCTLKFDGWRVEVSKRQEMGINKAPKNSTPIRTVEYVKATQLLDKPDKRKWIRAWMGTTFGHI